MNHTLPPFKLRLAALLVPGLLCAPVYRQGFSPHTETRLRAVPESFGLVELYNGQVGAHTSYKVSFDAWRLRSGLYPGRLVSDGSVRTHTLVVTR